ncbi:MAG: ABC transporter ATP-binding protein [Acidimicrobiia bacterium]|nr:ABC transporter ATP-binding protein [Acidimicrobiia bacterium]MDX2466786.1 ABC transporter ATP-binding protein [Acidimicrobiia bacterium]
MNPVVELEGVTRTFPGSPPVEAVRDADLVVGEGGYLAIVGPSGSGKSTLLHILGCLDTPTSGSYRLRGIDVGSLSDGDRTSLRGSEVGFVFQAFHLLPYRSVIENVVTGLVYNRTPRKVRRRRASEALERVGLGHRMDFKPTQLSGGERQRVAIARAIAAEPSLLLCDEPTGNLDTKTTVAILDLFDELRTDGLTLIVITHEERVSRRADRRIEMVDGCLKELVAP